MTIPFLQYIYYIDQGAAGAVLKVSSCSKLPRLGNLNDVIDNEQTMQQATYLLHQVLSSKQ